MKHTACGEELERLFKESGGEAALPAPEFAQCGKGSLASRRGKRSV